MPDLTSHPGAVEIVLEGGPVGISPAGVLGGRSLADQDRLKVPFRGGYEYYERLATMPVAGTLRAVFRWVAASPN
ncbi:DUF5988 family protein [Labedaea rhizosphaerae]|uniref:Uncharacterized protein n=1 Tax=Labedaea rhizosphaerae TaxID=598644 RepID=A0A4R6SAQ0_LABRH|nr:DUF5988 family protein [Labedaea rhizosphaerae]TDP96603.1 hypothetical protein EV186_104591 [Labedaea rhizosphaerae]